MFRLSKGAEYAVRGVLHLASKPSGVVAFIDEIAEAEDVPRAYLAKIFQVLLKKGFLRSKRGPGGGFNLAREAKDITLLDIIETMEGTISLNDCLISAGFCEREDKCPVHDVWREAQKKLKDFLSNSNFKELAEAGRVKVQFA